MKKFFAMLVLAAMTLTASAQGLKTFDCKMFTCQYPDDFETQEQWMDEAFNAKIKGSQEFFSVSVMKDQDMTVQQLKDWAEGMRMMTERQFGEPTGWKAGPVVLKGKTVTFRSEGEEDDYIDGQDVKVPTVKMSFCMAQPGKIVFCGELKFKKSNEAKYKPLFNKILASLKAK